MGYRFELQTPEDEAVGTFETSRSEWRVGDKFLAAGNRSYQITAITPLNGDDSADQVVHGRWQVEPL